MKKIIFSLLAAVALTAAYGQGVGASNKVTVTGEVVNRGESSSKVITANFQNPFDDGGSSPSAPLDPVDGSFRIEYEMPYGQSINVRYGRRFITLFAAPGDSLHLRIDASKIDGKDVGAMIRYSGDRAELNTLFTPAYAYFTSGRGFFDKNMPPDSLPAAVGERIRNDRDSLTAYARREKLPAEVVQWLDSEIVCGALYYAAMYRKEEPLGEVMNRIFTEVVDIFDPRYAASSMYGVDLGWYRARCLPIDPALIEDPDALMRHCIGSMRAIPAGPARDILVSTLLDGFHQQFPGTVEKHPELPALLVSDYARQRYARSAEREKQVPEFRYTPLTELSRITADLQSEPLPEVDMFQYLAERHRGKVVYIDVSAHWCGPCIAQFPHAKRLELELAGEEVVFVILWLESAFDRTAALIREHELHGEHYFFSADASRLFRGAYGISGFPTYLLMDRSGKLVDMDARRPADPRAESRIRELLR